MPPVYLFRHRVKDVGVNLHILQKGDSGVFNIFFHGFTAVTSEKDIELFRTATGFTENDTNILVQWDSGNIKKEAVSSLSSILGALTNPITAVATVMGSAIQNVASSFGANQENADKLAFCFSEVIELALKGRDVHKLNLIGHSLGGRIIVNGLAWMDSPLQYPLSKVLLMGAAVEWPKQPIHILKDCDVTLFNLYSAVDGALTIKTDTEKCIGKHGIPETSDNIRQIHCKGYGHTEYWSNLCELVGIVGFYGKTPLNDDIFDVFPMRAIQMALQDKPLISVLEAATPDELAVLADFLVDKNSSSITKGEQNPIKLACAIQFLGGDSAANMTRGYGVSYETIIEDVARLHKIPLEAEVLLPSSPELKSENPLTARLLQRMSAATNLPATKGQKERRALADVEADIVAAILDDCQRALTDANDEKLDEQIASALKKSGRWATIKASSWRSAMGAAGMAGVAGAAFLIPGVGLLLGAAVVGATGLATAVSAFSSAAYSALVPCIVTINTIRVRLQNQPSHCD